MISFLFMGHSNKDTVYCDLKNNRVLKIVGVNNTSTEEVKKKSKKAAAYSATGVLALDGILALFNNNSTYQKKYSLAFFVALVVIELIGGLIVDVVYFQRRAYPPKGQFKLYAATKTDFLNAFKNNLFYKFNENLQQKFSYVCLKLLGAFGMIFIFVIGPYVFMLNFSKVLGYLIIPICMYGVGLGFTRFFQFNTYQYWKVEKLYRENKLIFDEAKSEAKK